MNRSRSPVPGILAFLALSGALASQAAEPELLRAINLNGPALTVDGNDWEASSTAPNFKAEGKTFANQKVPLKPPSDAARTEMIRSSVWGGNVKLTFSQLPAGPVQVFLYVWEDNHNEEFDLLIDGQAVHKKFNSGSAGMWKKLGPWKAEPRDGKLVVTAQGGEHGAANLSGIELWSGDQAPANLSAMPFTDTPTPEQVAFFEKRIRPLLAEHCYQCHSADAKKLKGGLVLDSRVGVRKGGDTGTIITPGDPDASLLVIALRHSREEPAMPPDGALPPETIADFEEWVRMGAPDPRDTDTVALIEAREALARKNARQWWSFQPLATTPPPAVKASTWPSNDIDRFILARLEEKQLQPAPDADKRTLIRRATFDLTGLPPTPEEIAAFLADTSGEAFAKVVDRLLASPRYGERWGRHWLDVVRYADTAGDNSDYPIPQIYRYRDWVIDAFNRDLPYADFIKDQLAGDLRDGATEDERQQRLIATGYIANARRFGSRVDDYPQHLTIEDTLDNVGRAFLGLTLNCARCHDHKFDPLSTEDYYALYGIFNSTRYPWPGIELDKNQRDFVPLVPADRMTQVESELKKQAEIQKQLDRAVKDIEGEIKKLKDETDEKTKAEARLKTAQDAAARHKANPLPVELAYAVAEGTEIAHARVQQKGDPAKPAAIVPRRFLSLFGGTALPDDSAESGRAQLADWILSDGGALAYRVMANRIWQHHFAQGLTPTSNDFGRQGKPPTHPELLDYLAQTFQKENGSVKAMHRLIMLSRTYRTSSSRSDEALAMDPANEWLAGYPQRRLDAESIRDALLALGGNLDLSPAGPHPFPPQSEWKFTQHNPFKAVYDTHHRSVFLMTQRIQRHPYLAIFDGADPSASTPARPVSTTPLQALFLLNDPFIHAQADLVAQRLQKSAPDDAARVGLAYEWLFARWPSAGESADSLAFLTQMRARLAEQELKPDQLEANAWSAFVRVLFRLNEFVYLD